MTETKACRSCGTMKPLDLFRQTRSGGRLGTCRACEALRVRTAWAAGAEQRRQVKAAKDEQRRQARAAKAAEVEQRRAARLAAMNDADRERAEQEAGARQRAAEAARRRAAAAAALATEAAAVERRINDSGMLDQKSRSERDKALKDALWGTMRHHREGREERAVQPSPDPRHRIKLKGNRGYISIAEFACRVAEREACHRAGKASKLLPAACETIALLERSTEGPKRTCDMLSRGLPAEAAPAVLRGDHDDEVEPFGDAFGDWAPAWMQAAARL
jgi:hypothetical protein